jgi:hypothetical protein
VFSGGLRTVSLPKKRRYLLIDDEVPAIPGVRIFDPRDHYFNPLRGIDYRSARVLSEIFYALSPQGENTLTVRNGKRAMLDALLHSPNRAGRWGKKQHHEQKPPERLDKVQGDDEVNAMIRDVLASPVLKGVFCNPTNFSFNPNSVIVARVNRAELGEYDALVLGLMLMSHYRGQIVLPDGGFYLRDIHTALIRENRLIAGVDFLNQLPVRLRNSALLIEDK